VGWNGLEVGDGWSSSLLLFGGARVCCDVSGSVVVVVQTFFTNISKIAFEKGPSVCLNIFES
jgi:hypothetical protein